jgi:hypothetical protein
MLKLKNGKLLTILNSLREKYKRKKRKGQK